MAFFGLVAVVFLYILYNPFCLKLKPSGLYWMTWTDQINLVVFQLLQMNIFLKLQ